MLFGRKSCISCWFEISSRTIWLFFCRVAESLFKPKGLFLEIGNGQPFGFKESLMHCFSNLRTSAFSSTLLKFPAINGGASAKNCSYRL
ncbi:unnamed protein product [Cuscuta campestris]|uniref:Uncharacterized protein n=1 Tax=Cuscuta campestris TaxID=132261 RepID=A0A484M1I0_9ASTE|nr:unnamed protein product [Cuscuta campestris]